MPEEGFLRRWARVKANPATAQAEAQAAAARPAAPAPEAPVAPAPAAWSWGRAGDVAPAQDASASPVAAPAEAGGPASPTLEDVARLTPDSDYSIFVGKSVDKSVQRLALKKLFADPHFNVMDRLDMYMDDYNIPSPVSEEMLASLDHARSALRRFVEEPSASAADQAPAAGDALAGLPADAAPAQAAASAPAEVSAPGIAGHDAVAHNEAAHAAAAHEDSPAGEACDAASTHEPGPFHRPNQQLSQGQV